MTTLKLQWLPRELIASIACCCDASSVLRLSATSKGLRSACYDSLVFKTVLTARHRHNWEQSSLDIDAIALRASNDVGIWARFAVADERAWELRQNVPRVEVPKSFIAFLPELFVVKHPFMNESCWNCYFQPPLDQKQCHIFCFVMATLASNEDAQDLLRSTRHQHNLRSRSSDMESFLWALFTIALTLRSSLKTRLAIWPYNSDAVVPHIPTPRASQIPLRPISNEYSLPVPFSRRAIDIMGPTSFSSWDSWVDLHNYAAFRSTSFLTEGSWCGYYISTGMHANRFDPPMIEINFEVVSTSNGNRQTVGEAEMIHLRALNCVDGIDRFDISGKLSYQNREVTFTGWKHYKNQPTSWAWDCRLTPFGFIGFWGPRALEFTRHRDGIVWLWKKSWTETTQ